jgi:hypothetical protein
MQENNRKRIAKIGKTKFLENKSRFIAIRGKEIATPTKIIKNKIITGIVFFKGFLWLKGNSALVLLIAISIEFISFVYTIPAPNKS